MLRFVHCHPPGRIAVIEQRLRVHLLTLSSLDGISIKRLKLDCAAWLEAENYAWGDESSTRISFIDDGSCACR